MRGQPRPQDTLFIYRSMEDRIPADHPLRVLRPLVDQILAQLSPLFDQMYSPLGRASIPPEQLLKALLLQILYSIRSERQLMEQLNFNLLYRWFVGLSADAEVWDDTTFSKNRDRLEADAVEAAFFTEVTALAEAQGFLSSEHFTVDGSLLDAAASLKSFRPKDGSAPPPPAEEGRNPTVNFHGEQRSNTTHASTTDPDARLARKGAGKEAKLALQASVVTENRHGLIVATDVRSPSGKAEREAAVSMLIELAPPPGGRATVGADKGYDTRDFVTDARTLGFTPHVAQKKTGSAVDGRTAGTPGYAVSQQKRKLVEQSFGWGKTIGLLRKLRHRSVTRVAGIFALTCAAFNLVRLRTLLAEVRP